MGYHLEWARAVMGGAGFRPGEPFFRAPLYPWLLAGLLTLARGSVLIALIAQCALGGVTTALTFLLGRRALGPSSAAPTFAAAMVAVSWVLIDFDAQLLLEPLLIPLILAGLYVALPLCERATAGRALFAGLWFGLAAITRPNVLLVMPALALWLMRRARGLPRGGWRATAALTLGTLAPIAPITAYNTWVAHDPALIATQGGVNFWIGNNPASDGRTAVVPGTRAGWWEGYHDAIAQAEAAEGRPLKATEVSRHYTGRALAWARAAPGRFLAHLAYKTRLLLAGAELGNNVDPRYTALAASPWLALSPVHTAWVLAFAALGLARAWPDRRALAPLYLFLACYAASVVLFFVNARFRAPMLPVLYLFAAHGALWVAAEARARRWRRCGALVTSALVGTWLAALPPRAPEIGAVNGRVTQALGHVAACERLTARGDVAGAERAAASATALLEEALAMRPDWTPAWRALGGLRRQQGDVVGALAAFERALATSQVAGAPLDEESVDGYCGALSRAGRFAELADFARPLAQAQDGRASAGATYYLGVLAQRAGRLERARALYEESERLRPGRFRAPFALGTIALAEGDMSRARAHFEAADRRREDGLPEQQAQLARELARMRAPAAPR
ncbi:MAG: glycosyltransferase family 39 protein [Planctomycetota bacterium]